MAAMTINISCFLLATIIIKVAMGRMTAQYIKNIPELYGDYDPRNRGLEIPESDFDDLCKEALDLAKRDPKEGDREFAGFMVELKDSKDTKINALECPSSPSNIYVFKISDDNGGTYIALVVHLRTYLKGQKYPSGSSSESSEQAENEEIPPVPKFTGK